MKWLVSLKGSILLSASTLVVFIGYAFVEMKYFLGEWISSDGVLMLITIFLLAIIGGWQWAILIATVGRRSGLISLLALSLFTTLVAIYDLQYVLFYQIPWPEQVMVIAILVFGIFSTFILSIQLKRYKK